MFLQMIWRIIFEIIFGQLFFFYFQTSYMSWRQLGWGVAWPEEGWIGYNDGHFDNDPDAHHDHDDYFTVYSFCIVQFTFTFLNREISETSSTFTFLHLTSKSGQQLSPSDEEVGKCSLKQLWLLSHSESTAVPPTSLPLSPSWSSQSWCWWWKWCWCWLWYWWC